MSQLPHFRRAQPSDAAALQRLYSELVPGAPICVSAEHLALLSESLGSHLIVAELQTAVVGTMLVTICPDAMYQTQPFALLENLVVSERFRRQGIGRLLLSEAQSIAQRHDCSKMLLLSSIHRVGAHSLFQSLGFSGDSKRGFVKYRSDF